MLMGTWGEPVTVKENQVQTQTNQGGNIQINPVMGLRCFGFVYM